MLQLAQLPLLVVLYVLVLGQDAMDDDRQDADLYSTQWTQFSRHEIQTHSSCRRPNLWKTEWPSWRTVQSTFEERSIINGDGMVVTEVNSQESLVKVSLVFWLFQIRVPKAQ